MHVIFMRRESTHDNVMWEIHDGKKWWTANFHTRDGSWSIMSSNLVEVKPGGRLGRKIIAAIEKHK